MIKSVKYLFFFTAFLGFSTLVWTQEERGPKVEKTTPKATGQTWALIVGVSQYQHINSLRFASDDAKAFYNFLLSPAGGSVPQSNVQLLLNEKATMGQVDRAMGNLLSFAKPNDRVFIYFSGHGDQESKTIAERGFLLTNDAFSSNYNSTAFAVLYLQDYIATLSTKNQAQVIMFLDACRSGKLAGDEIGGVQLMGQQLLKQVAKEVKFMSCQANELSLEGYQWGGGRGLFSYHLIRGMQGLADADQDKQVTLRELERYLEDHVTPEAAPNRQNPLLIAADKSLPLVQIDPPTLEALQKNLPAPAFVAVQGKGFAEKILDQSAPTVRGLYSDFQNAVEQKQLFDSPDNAEASYDKLIESPAVEELKPFIDREFAAALLEESAKTLAEYLGNAGVVKTAAVYQKSIRYLEKVYLILGKTHHLYPNLRAQVFYYKGLIAEPTNANEALSNYREAIESDSTFSPAYNDLGRMLYLKKSYSEAQRIFEKGLIYAPNWSFLHLNYGVVLAAQNKWTEAETAYKKSLELKPDDAVAYKNYGALLAQQNRAIESEVAYKKSISLGPNDPETYNNYGILLNAEKRYIEAEVAFKKALELHPNDAQVYHNFGNALASQNRQAEAEAAYQKSIQLFPSDAQVYLNYGNLLNTQNRQAEAEINFKKSIELNPNNALVYGNYGYLLADQNRLTEAEIAYKKYIELNPNNALIYGNYGNLLDRQNRRREAESAYKKSIELDPNYANVHKNYANFLKNQNRLTEAEIAYKKFIELKADDAGVYRSYGMLLVSLKRNQEAELAYKKAIELDATDASVYNSYGILLSAQSRWAEAEVAYKKSIEIDSTKGLVYSNYGNLLARQGRLPEAEIAYKRAIALTPDDANLYNNYGSLLENLNRLTEAESAYKKVIELNANYFRAYYYLAGIKSQQNVPTEALDWLNKALEKGYKDFDNLSRDARLDSLREMPEFKALIEKYKR